MGWRHRASALLCVLLPLLALLGPPLGAPAASIALVGLNRSFYALLLRRLGLLNGALGVGLHWLHHLVAVAAVPVGVVVAVRALRQRSPAVPRLAEVPSTGAVAR